MGMPLSLDGLPAEVLEQILAFVASEPISLCRVACTCKTLLKSVSSYQHLWKRLYRMRWTYPNKRIPFISQVGYRQRHVRDSHALDRVLTIAKNVKRKRHYGLGGKYNDPMWIQMCEDVDSFDVLRGIVRKNPDEIQTWFRNKAQHITPLVQSVAAQLMEHVHFRIVMQNFYAIFTRPNGHGVERACLLISQGLWTWSDLVRDDCTSWNHLTCAAEKVRNTLELLQASLTEMGGVGRVRPLDAVRRLKTLLVEEQGIVVDRNGRAGTNVHSLLLDHALETKMGVPIILAIIYVCLLRHVDVRAEIVRLADERIVLGLVDEAIYLDVYDDVDSSERLMPSPWDPIHQEPLSFGEVLNSILSSLFSRFANRGTTFQSCTTQLVFSMARTRLLQHLTYAHTKLTKPFGLNRWLTCYVDPEIFLHFGLISERRTRRYTTAMLRHAILFALAETLRSAFDRNYHHDLTYLLD